MNKKRWVLALGALGFTGYGAYTIYQLPSVVKKRERLFKLVGALVSLAETVCLSSEAIGILSRDFKEFIQSDSNQIPQSLKQVSEIIQSNEISDSLTRITRALIVGILSGYRLEVSKNGYSWGADSDFPERIMDKLFSSAGSGFASVVVGSFARNLVMAFCSEWKQDRISKSDGSSSNDHGFPVWIEAVFDHHKCRELIGDCVQLFVSTAVTVYFEKTMNINTYNELFSGLTNPKNEAKVKDMMVSVCSNAVETFIRTSHQVLTTDNDDVSKPNLDYCSKIDFDGSFFEGEKVTVRRKLSSVPLQVRKFKNQNGGLMTRMSSALAVPRNQKFVIDTTGVVAFQWVRSFLEFTLEKISEPLKRSLDVVEDEVVARGVRTIRYVRGKSFAVTAECITLCLNILNSPWILTTY